MEDRQMRHCDVASSSVRRLIACEVQLGNRSCDSSAVWQGGTADGGPIESGPTQPNSLQTEVARRGIQSPALGPPGAAEGSARPLAIKMSYDPARLVSRPRCQSRDLSPNDGAITRVRNLR